MKAKHYQREDFPEFNAVVYTFAPEDGAEEGCSEREPIREEDLPYFESPAQCKYYDSFSGPVAKFVGGIAYRNFVISGMDGVPIPIREIYESAPSTLNPLITYNDWQSLDYQIRLGDYNVRKED